MEFQDVVRRRRMVRRFTADPVDPASVDRVLRNAVRAPSAGFAQGWAFVVLTEPDDVARFWAASTPADSERDMSAWLDGMRTAPVIVLVLTSKDAYLRRYAEDDKGWADRDENRWAVPYWHVDAGMASLIMLQTAVDEGLGACFFGVPAERVDALRTAFGVPDTHRPVGVVSVGYPGAEDRRSPSLRRGRRGVEEVVHRGRW
jgi:nitroreductase